jgi:hypothetical protein
MKILFFSPQKTVILNELKNLKKEILLLIYIIPSFQHTRTPPRPQRAHVRQIVLLDGAKDAHIPRRYSLPQAQSSPTVLPY